PPYPSRGQTQTAPRSHTAGSVAPATPAPVATGAPAAATTVMTRPMVFLIVIPFPAIPPRPNCRDKVENAGEGENGKTAIHRHRVIHSRRRSPPFCHPHPIEWSHGVRPERGGAVGRTRVGAWP